MKPATSVAYFIDKYSRSLAESQEIKDAFSIFLFFYQPSLALLLSIPLVDRKQWIIHNLTVFMETPIWRKIMASHTLSQTFEPSIDSSNPSTPMEDVEETIPASTLQKQDTQHKNSLPAVLSRRDLTALMLLIVLFIANTSAVQFGGPASFLYWALGLVTFLIPCAAVTQWLGKRFPGQGAPYLWTTRILGPRWSFFSAFCAWLPGVLAVVSAIESGIIFIQFLAPTWFTSQAEQALVVVLVLVICTAIACLPLRWLKWLLCRVALLYLSVFLLLGVAGGFWLLSGHQAAVALNVPTSWKPTGGNFGVYGVVILALLGADIPIFMGGEVRGGKAAARRATSYVWWGTGLSILAYVIGTFGVMVIVPPAQSGVMSANVQAISTVFGPLAGTVVDVVLIISQFALTVAYILMFSRLLVVTAQDRRLPTKLARVNRQGVPALSIVVHAAAVATVTLISLVVVPSLFGTLIRPDDLATAIYDVLQAGTTVVWVCTIIQLFVLVLWFLSRRKPGKHGMIASAASARHRILLRVISIVGIVASGVGIWATISSSWLPTIPNGRWAWLVLGVTVISMAVGLISSELPRVHALLSEQRRANEREVALRGQLQTSYDEQALLVQQQQVLLAEVDRLYREQAHAAVTDAITCLPNHRAIMGRIEEEISRCQRLSGNLGRDEGGNPHHAQDSYAACCAILFVDLDHFKRINDTWGHRAGDAILREIGSRLASTVRLEDFVGRYGGEEFAVVLTNADLPAASSTAERLREAVAEHPYYWEVEETNGVVPISVTASIGIAIYGLHGTTRESLIEHADAAMYQAKHTGRNRVCIAEVVPTGTQVIEKEGVLLISEKPGRMPAPTEVAAVQALTLAASTHDRGTDAHAHRMVHLAEATARVLGQTEEELHLLRLAALLHDIGKIGIPDAILRKPGPLTDEEWAVMRRHPEIGRQILKQMGGIFQYLADIIVAHHERWDGMGYPNGLAKDEIPLYARILCVVDSYDAMTSRRPYREPMSVAEARAELQRCSGRQYDPLVVEAFLSVLDEEECTMPDLVTNAPG